MFSRMLVANRGEIAVRAFRAGREAGECTWKEPEPRPAPAHAEALSAGRRGTLNRLLFPRPTRDVEDSCRTYGDLSVLPTGESFYGLRHGAEHTIPLGPGQRVLMGLQAVGEPDERGYRTVMRTVDGQLRPVVVRDQSVASVAAAAEKAECNDPGHVAAPFQDVVTVDVAVGDTVNVGDPVATIEAMRRQAAIAAQASGTVLRVALPRVSPVDGGDLVLVITQEEQAK